MCHWQDKAGTQAGDSGCGNEAMFKVSELSLNTMRNPNRLRAKHSEPAMDGSVLCVKKFCGISTLKEVITYRKKREKRTS